MIKKGCLTAIMIIGLIAAIVMCLWYDSYFAKNCLSSHTEPYTYTYYLPIHLSKYSTIYIPETGHSTRTICDEWKKGTN